MLRSHLMNPHIIILRPDLVPFVLWVEVVAAPHSRAFPHLGLFLGPPSAKNHRTFCRLYHEMRDCPIDHAFLRRTMTMWYPRVIMDACDFSAMLTSYMTGTPYKLEP